MSHIKYPLRFVARISIEAETPFIISSGEPDFFSDAVFVADANGLPAIPGSSIAGVLRHEFERHYNNKQATNDLFGFQEQGDGQGSRLIVSWACIHDRNNIPVEGIAAADRLKDEVLRKAAYSIARDHVCITHRGVAKDKGKFDEQSVAAGHRFTFELMLEGSEDDRAAWRSLLGAIASGTLRFGGKTRRGYGSFRTASIKEDFFNITTDEGFNLFIAHPVSLSMPSPLKEKMHEFTATARMDKVIASIHLLPEGFWMIGGGMDDDVDMSPVKESKILWDNGKGKVGEEEVLIPATAVKGAISHRTAYHYNAINAVFADNMSKDELDKHTGDNNSAIRELFGYCPDEKDKEDGQRGKVVIDDIFIGTPDRQKILNHVSIDRFTGGAAAGALFTEKPFYKGEGFVLKLIIDEPNTIPPAVRKAFGRALDDLASGRLGIGAGSGRGNGYFKARNGLIWNDNGKWIGGEL